LEARERGEGRAGGEAEQPVSLHLSAFFSHAPYPLALIGQSPASISAGVAARGG